MTKTKISLLAITLIACLVSVVAISPIASAQSSSLSFARQVLNWRAVENAQTGYVEINSNITMWCVSNCGKLAQVDPSAFATEETQKAKLLQTQLFLNQTFASVDHTKANNLGIYCEGMHSVNPNFRC